MDWTRWETEVEVTHTQRCPPRGSHRRGGAGGRWVTLQSWHQRRRELSIEFKGFPIGGLFSLLFLLPIISVRLYKTR